ncbi:hypothetical protein L3Q82_020419 [Scortum barcoo]|uniref:Uncharacterized protein n=1 Tax=Scortum barcoo TaxID=214431 RepID=A0ACB8V7G0_9TELE|nr:hypothetical protein L3Q82_020419 [Scortum barcoo]
MCRNLSICQRRDTNECRMYPPLACRSSGGVVSFVDVGEGSGVMQSERLVRVSHGKQVLGDGARLRAVQKPIMKEKNIKDRYVPRIGVASGPPPWSQAWGWGSQAERLVARSLPTGTRRAQPEMARRGPAFQ